MQDRLGDYQILRQIGEGSLGTTFLAEHCFIKKLYILKVLPESMAANRSFIERFEREVIRLASLDHPHIAKIHTVSFAEGKYFLVTDCISAESQGETMNLTEMLQSRKERFSESELSLLAHQIAGALDSAHTKKGGEPMAHLSLKLSNVLIAKKSPHLEVVLSDFGLAKIIGPGAILANCFKTVALTLNEGESLPYPIEASSLSSLSRSFLESFAFLAPEQKMGHEVVGPAADIFAFGILIYYLISGRFPEGSFPLPSEISSDFNQEWDHLVKSCLNPRPEKRPSLVLPMVEETSLTKISAGRPRFQEELKRETSVIEGLKAALKEERVEEPVLVAAATMAMATAPIVSSSGMPLQMMNSDPHVIPFHQEHQEYHSIAPLLTEMKVIPAGTYFRGSNEGSRDEMPRHKVHLRSFAIDIHPVTNNQFVHYLDYMSSEKDEHYNDLIRLKDSRISRHGGKYLIESGYEKHPVVGVTWYGADGYAKWIGRRLPTEVEWEIAAKGGSEPCIFPTGENIEKHQANFFSSDTAPVMSYAPNGFGLFDMAGNVYEWCQDWYGYNYYETSVQEPNNPKGPVQGVYRVLRGGCWKSLKEDLRCSHRHRNNPGTVTATYGFRTAADV